MDNTDLDRLIEQRLDALLPKKLAEPSLRIEKDTLVGTLDYGPVRVATGTMGYKHRALDLGKVKVGRSTISFKRLADVELPVLLEVVEKARDQAVALHAQAQS